jgi:hypothetical protein
MSIVAGIVTIETRFVTMLMTRAVATSPLKTLVQNEETIADGQQRASMVPAYIIGGKKGFVESASTGTKANVVNRPTSMIG